MIQWLRLIKFISQNGYQCLTAKCWVRCKSWGQSKQLVSQDILSLCALFLLLVGLPERRCTDFEEPRRPKWAPSFYGIRNIDTCWNVRGILVLLKINDKGQNPECLPCTFFSSFFACTVHSEHYQQLCYPPLAYQQIWILLLTLESAGVIFVALLKQKVNWKVSPLFLVCIFFVLVQPPHCLLLGIFARTGGGSSPSRGNAKPRNGLKQNRWGMDEWHDNGTQDTIDERFTSV